MLQVSLLRPFVLLALLVLTGCASFQGSSLIVEPDRLGEVAAEVAGGQGILSLVDGTRYLVEGLRIEPDTTSWVDPQTGDLRLVATPFVAVFESRNRRRSMFRGAGTGAVVAGIAGASLGLLICSDVGCGEETPIIVLGLGALSMPSGAFWGGVIGAISDPLDRWTFVRPEEPDADAGGPGRPRQADGGP